MAKKEENEEGVQPANLYALMQSVSANIGEVLTASGLSYRDASAVLGRLQFQLAMNASVETSQGQVGDLTKAHEELLEELKLLKCTVASLVDRVDKLTPEGSEDKSEEEDKQ